MFTVITAKTGVFLSDLLARAMQDDGSQEAQPSPSADQATYTDFSLMQQIL